MVNRDLMRLPESNVPYNPINSYIAAGKCSITAHLQVLLIKRLRGNETSRFEFEHRGTHRGQNRLALDDNFQNYIGSPLPDVELQPSLLPLHGSPLSRRRPCKFMQLFPVQWMRVFALGKSHEAMP